MNLWRRDHDGVAVIPRHAEHAWRFAASLDIASHLKLVHLFTSSWPSWPALWTTGVIARPPLTFAREGFAPGNMPSTINTNI